MNNERLCFPALGGFYRTLSGPSVVLMRVLAGVALMMHGWGKIQDPMAMVGFVENIGFHPGWLWSPALACTEFVGGLLLALGLFTRFAGAGTTIVLLVTVWFHWILKDEGWGGAEKSLIWMSVTFYFAVHGGQVFALDRLFKREL